MQYNLQTKL